MYMDMSVVEVEEEEVALVRDVKPALEWLCQNMERMVGLVGTPAFCRLAPEAQRAVASTLEEDEDLRDIFFFRFTHFDDMDNFLFILRDTRGLCVNACLWPT